VKIQVEVFWFVTPCGDVAQSLTTQKNSICKKSFWLFRLDTHRNFRVYKQTT